MKHSFARPIIALLVIAIFGGGGWYIDHQRNKQRVALSGFFESQPSEISSRIGGRTARILVKEGDTVHAGQPLLEFETIPAEQDTAAKKAAAEQAEQQLKEVQNGPRREDIQKQEESVAELSANLERLRNGPLPEEIAGARAHLNQTLAMLSKAVAGPRPQEIAQVRAAEQSAKARLAQAQRGLTLEEKSQAKARLDAANAQKILAIKEMARTASLFSEGAVSRQQVDQTRAEEEAATAKSNEMEEAYRRAEEGTPAEELRQYQEAYLQAKAALDLELAGTRKEDIDAARADSMQARQSLKLLLRGSRKEDIQAAEARLKQAQTALKELNAGNRKEQIAQAEAAAIAAKAQAKSSQKTLEERILRAPQDGVIERILTAVGDLISPGMAVIRMENPSDIWVRVFVPEGNLSQVAVGAEVQLKVDGISALLPGEVESIASAGEFTPANIQTPEERGKQVFAVRIRLKQVDLRVKAGMAVTVTRIGAWSPS